MIQTLMRQSDRLVVQPMRRAACSASVPWPRRTRLLGSSLALALSTTTAAAWAAPPADLPRAAPAPSLLPDLTAPTQPGDYRLEPALEAGIGLTTVSAPLWRGAAGRRTLALPFPWYVLRTANVLLDRSGLKASILDRNRLEVDVSLAGSLPVSGDADPVRAGMPGLRATLEFGPQVRTLLWRGTDARLVFELPLRYAMTLGSGLRDAGLVLHPRLRLPVRRLAADGPLSHWGASLTVGPQFATARQHAFFYSVPTEYATPARPAYAARGGYSGMQFSLSLARRWSDWQVSGFMRLDLLQGSAMAASPLLSRPTSWAAGLSLIWIPYRSEARVRRRVEE